MSSCFVQPVVTPCTAFDSRERSRPCFDRSGPVSPLRETVRVFPSTSRGKPGKTAWITFPLGPSAVNRPSWISILVPLGIGIGIFPMRDIVDSLPDLAEQLAAHPALARRG